MRRFATAGTEMLYTKIDLMALGRQTRYIRRSCQLDSKGKNMKAAPRGDSAKRENDYTQYRNEKSRRGRSHRQSTVLYAKTWTFGYVDKEMWYILISTRIVRKGENIIVLLLLHL